MLYQSFIALLLSVSFLDHQLKMTRSFIRLKLHDYMILDDVGSLQNKAPDGLGPLDGLLVRTSPIDQ